MHSFPHHYRISATAGPEGDVALSGDGLDAIASAPPVEFGGPGDRWSPETLLVASVADCFMLSFRAIARASKFSWVSLDCSVEGKLDRVEGETRFTEFLVRASLEVSPGANEERAHRLLEKAEKTCLITNSLSSTVRLDAQVRAGPGS